MMKQKKTYHSLITASISVVIMVIIGGYLWHKYTPSDKTIVLPESASLDQITTQKWVWRQTIQGGEVIAKPIDSRKLFTVTLAPDGKVAVTTDCNSAGGNYTVDRETNTLSFSPFAMTLRFCEYSQETTFITELDQVTSFSYRNNTLYLNLKDDAGRMEFGLDKK